MSDLPTLHDLQHAHLPRLDWRDIFTVKGELDPAEVHALEAYFSRFLHPAKAPAKAGACVRCGEVQGGSLIDALFSGGARFTWGLAHGEGFCEVCKYPGRALHYDVGPIKALRIILQYHPDDLSERKDDQ